MRTMHEIDYKIFGDDMQFVEIELDPQEAAVAEAGAMMYMEDGIEMETIFGDGSAQQSGFLGALMGAGKRLLTGESLFMTVFYSKCREEYALAPEHGRLDLADVLDVNTRPKAEKRQCSRYRRARSRPDQDRAG